MDTIVQINLIEAVLLAGIFVIEIVFGFLLFSRLNAIERGFAYMRIKEARKSIDPIIAETKPKNELDLLDANEAYKLQLEANLKKADIPVQEQLAKIKPQERPPIVSAEMPAPPPLEPLVKESAKGKCDWCGGEYSNIPVHKRFCKSKPTPQPPAI